MFEVVLYYLFWNIHVLTTSFTTRRDTVTFFFFNLFQFSCWFSFEERGKRKKKGANANWKRKSRKCECKL